MANMTFKTSLLPNTDLGYSLGSSNKRWNIYGTLTGNASSATKLGNTTLGSTTKPIYLNAGVPTECSSYAGGTAVTLNNSSKAASTATFYAPTNGGTKGYPLIGDGTTSAPIWHGGLVLSGTATGSYIASFKGTTDATSYTEAAVTIAGGLGIAKKLYSNSEFYIGTDNIGKIYSGAEYTLSGSTTTITHDNFATYFTENSVDNTYPWTYNTTENYWESSGVTQDIDNIASVVMAEWKALSKMALHIDYTIHSESQTADYLRIDVNGVNKFQKGGKNLSGRGTIYLNTNDIVRFILRKDGSVTATPTEYYRAVLSRQNYSSIAAVQIVKNLVPSDSNTQNLGAPSYRWAKLYIGSQDTYGSSSKPIYWNAGVPTECTNAIPTIKLNGTDTTSANFYAPTSAGTSGYFLKSNGSGAAPTWQNIATTDTLVKQTVKSDNVNYKLLMSANSSPSSGTAYEAVYDTAITVNPSTDTITATNFAGTATKATKLTNTSKIGDTNKPVYFTANGTPEAINITAGNATTPVYFSSGTITAGNTYAGGTAVTLNGTSKAASTATFYAPTSYGTSGYPLIGAGNNTAPTWHGGLILSGTAASSYIAAFKGTTDATSSTEAAVTIAGGLAVAKKIYANSEFYLGTDSVGKVFSGADYTLSGSATTIDTTNISTYFTINNTDATYPWEYDTTNNCWALTGVTQGIHNINNIIMAEWKALSNFALIVEATVNAEHNYDYFEILVNGTQRFTTKGGSGTGTYNANGNVYLKTNDIVQFRFKKDGSNEGDPEYYRAILKRQSYSSVAAIQIVKNLLPNTNNSQSLGSSAYHWSKLYVGSQDTYGSSSKPIYWNAGIPTECSVSIPTIKLNGSDTSSANFYAPTSAGTSGYFLKSNGTNTAPSWENIIGTDILVKQTAKSDNVNYKILASSNSSPTSGTAYEAVYDTAITINPSTDTITATNFAGNASTTTKLQTARDINGTSFDGTANITTANWGTARTITIGGTGKSVNGSADVSWSKAEILGSSSSAYFYRGDQTWSDTISENTLKITNNSNTLTIGSQNSSYCHIENSADIPFYFNRNIYVNGHLYPYGDTNTKNLGSSTSRWAKLYIGTADSYGSAQQPVYWNAGVPAAIDLHVGNSSIGERDCNNIMYNCIGYYTSNGPATSLGASTNDGAIYTQGYNTSWVAQIAQDYRNGGLYVRGKNNGTWQSWIGIPKMTVESYPALLPPNGANNWIKVGTSNTSYGLLPSQAGNAGNGHNYLGTSTWYWKYAYIDQIYGYLNGNISGSAASATKATQDQNGLNIASGYLKLTGGAMTGAIQYNGKGNNSIYNGPNDQAATYNGTLNNFVISSWYGVSFTTSCTGQTCTGKSAVSINCRNGYVYTGRTYGAVWNDYAEYRKDNPIEKEQQEPGRCVHEIGDGSLALTTKRLERGCEIISDTFGFAIGQDKENGYDTPIASSGRVLAYPYESIEEFKKHIGYCVCSGPNGTVSIMTDEEEEKYPGRIIGTISEIPTYEEWGTGKVKVNGRIWIRIR